MYSSELSEHLSNANAANATTAFTNHSSDAARIAFAALLHVPIPLLVLSNQKTVVLKNYAAEKLLGPDAVNGKTLSQLGVQIAQDGERKRYTWEVWNLEKLRTWACINKAIGVS